MNESELVDGAEYEGVGRSTGTSYRGLLVLESLGDSTGGKREVRLRVPGGATPFVRLDSLRPVSSPPAIAEKDRLFEDGCCLCGAEECAPGIRFDGISGHMGPQRLNPGADVCSACIGEKSTDEQWDAADTEITRRKQLAANTQPPAIDWDKTCCECGNLRTAHLAGCSRSKPVAKPDPYAVHNAKLSDAHAAAAMSVRDTLDTDKQRQAFRELDRGIKGPKYKYADSSVVFSTPTWESD
jgi:hypothetical protein